MTFLVLLGLFMGYFRKLPVELDPPSLETEIIWDFNIFNISSVYFVSNLNSTHSVYPVCIVTINVIFHIYTISTLGSIKYFWFCFPLYTFLFITFLLLHLLCYLLLLLEHVIILSKNCNLNLKYISTAEPLLILVFFFYWSNWYILELGVEIGRLFLIFDYSLVCCNNNIVAVSTLLTGLSWYK